MESRTVALRICGALVGACFAIYVAAVGAAATITGGWSFWPYAWIWALLAVAIVGAAIWISLATVPAQYWADRQTARLVTGKALDRQRAIIEDQDSRIATLEEHLAHVEERLGIVWVVSPTEIREKIIRSHGMRAELRPEGKYGVTREDSNDLLALIFRSSGGVVIEWNNDGNRGLAGPFSDFAEALREISIDLAKGEVGTAS